MKPRTADTASAPRSRACCPSTGRSSTTPSGRTWGSRTTATSRRARTGSCPSWRPGRSAWCYVNSREQSRALARTLRRRVPELAGSIAYYNAGLAREVRARVEDAFRSGELTCIVSTSAFGEGVDLPDIRHVVLYHMPFGATEFNQMSGRAGRDGDPASCYLLWNGNDFRLRRFLIDREYGEGAADEAPDPEARERARQNRYRLLTAMEGYCETTGCLRAYILRYFGDEMQAVTGSTGFLVLRQLDDENVYERVKHLNDINVGQMATKQVVSVGPDVSFEEACHVLADKRLKELPVVEDGKLIGALHRSDLMRAIASMLEDAER